MMSYGELRQHLKDTLSRPRYEHSLAVSMLAGRLAARHRWNVEKAKLAGLLHDCVKEWSPKKLLGYVKKHRLAVPHLSFIKKNGPNMVHAYVGAHYAKNQKWVRDANVLRAIRSHTLGHGKMSKPEKILYVADLASPDRRFPSAQKIRRLALRNLEAGFREAMALKISYQLKKSKRIHPYTVEVWNSMLARG